MKKNDKTVVSVLTNYFRDTYTLTPTSSGIKLNKTTYSSRQFLSFFIKREEAFSQNVGKSTYFKAIESVSKHKNISESMATEMLAEAVYTEMFNSTHDKAMEKTKGNTDITQFGYNYSNKIPIIDRSSNERLLYDSRRKCIDYGSCFESWKDFRNTQPKETKEIMNMAVMVADIFYDPLSEDGTRLEEVNGQEDVLSINAHVLPHWRQKEIENPILPPFFVKFMKHLFPHTESLNYVFHWLNFMMTDRNYTFLLLNGGRGIGKGTFSDIAKKLVGTSNFSKVSSGFFESRFNEELKHLRLAFFDEHEILKEHMSVWKQLPEKYLAIEGKGIKTMTFKNHASFIIANNLEARISLLSDERKFSVPLLATKKVNDVLGQDEFENFLRDLEDDPSLIANIGWWILKNGNRGDYNNSKPFITNSFHDIVEKALRKWQRSLIELIEKREHHEYELEALETILNGVGRNKIEKFLLSYQDRDGNYYGYVKQVKNGSRVIRPSEKYKPLQNFEDTEF